jgi:hypothetical protein
MAPTTNTDESQHQTLRELPPSLEGRLAASSADRGKGRDFSAQTRYLNLIPNSAPSA